MSMSEEQKKFVDNFIDGMGPVEAARKAGYSESTAQNPSQNILSSEKVQEAIKRKQTENLFALQNRLESLAEPAMKELKQLITSPTVKENTKLGAIKTVLDRIEELKEKVSVDLQGTVEHEHDLNLDDMDEEEKQNLIESVSKAVS